MAQSVGCVNIVVKTSGSPVVVTVDDDDFPGTVDDDAVDETDDDDCEVGILDDVDVVFVCPVVRMLRVCSWPEANDMALRASRIDRKTDDIVQFFLSRPKWSSSE